MSIIAMVRASTFIRFRLSKAETFSVKICVERIDDEGGQTFVHEITEQVVRSSVRWLPVLLLYWTYRGKRIESWKKAIKALPVI